MNLHHFQIRDPIHGVLFISPLERAVIESLPFQRLRNIKQLGFLDFAFPSATHSRYSHSLGAMHMAAKIFDRVISKDIAPIERNQMLQAVRLSALLHDVGHAPMSHSTEWLMPCLNNSSRRASHEDYTRAIILDSPLTKIISDSFGDVGINANMVACLLYHSCDEKFFHFGGIDFTPILRQIISSEIDADRMDYLMRDSFFCGVNYGKFDSDWLVENLISFEKDSSMFLGFKARALFAFEDFLLSRYHMFLSVYLHHTPIIMEKMLEKFIRENPQSFTLPSDIDEYLKLDDLDLWSVLKKSTSPWAERIVQRKPFSIVDERHALADDRQGAHTLHDQYVKLFSEEGIDVITANSTMALSNYVGAHKLPIFVENAQKKAVLLEEYSPVFMRYQKPTEIMRIYVNPKDKVKAERLIAERS